MLARHMCLSLPPAPVPVSDPYRDWCAHTFNAGRTPYLIVTNTHSMLSAVVRRAGIHNTRDLHAALLIAIGDYLRARNRTDLFETRVDTPDTRLATIVDRRVLGTITELVFQARLDLQEGRLPLGEIATRLNTTPLSLLWNRGAASSADRAFDEMERA